MEIFDFPISIWKCKQWKYLWNLYSPIKWGVDLSRRSWSCSGGTSPLPCSGAGEGSPAPPADTGQRKKREWTTWVLQMGRFLLYLMQGYHCHTLSLLSMSMLLLRWMANQNSTVLSLYKIYEVYHYDVMKMMSLAPLSNRACSGKDRTPTMVTLFRHQ